MAEKTPKDYINGDRLVLILPENYKSGTLSVLRDHFKKSDWSDVTRFALTELEARMKSDNMQSTSELPRNNRRRTPTGYLSTQQPTETSHLLGIKGLLPDHRTASFVNLIDYAERLTIHIDNLLSFLTLPDHAKSLFDRIYRGRHTHILFYLSEGSTPLDRVMPERTRAALSLVRSLFGAFDEHVLASAENLGIFGTTRERIALPPFMIVTEPEAFVTNTVLPSSPFPCLHLERSGTEHGLYERYAEIDVRWFCELDFTESFLFNTF